MNLLRRFRFLFFCPAALLIFCSAAKAVEPVKKGARTNKPVLAPWADFVQPDFPFFSGTLDARTLDNWATNNLTPRGLILNLGNDCWACFDVDLLRMSAIWQGKGSGVTPVGMAQISYQQFGTKVPEGQGKLAQIIGTPWIINGLYPGWQIGEKATETDPREPGLDKRETGRGAMSESMGRFKAIQLTQGGVRLEYTVGNVFVREWVESKMEGGNCFVQRRFQLAGGNKPLWLMLGKSSVEESNRLQLVLISEQVDKRPLIEVVEDSDGLKKIHVQPSKNAIEFSVAMGLTLPKKTLENSSVSNDNSPAKIRWPQEVITKGILSSAKESYVTDNIALPLDNPWKRNMRLADIQFFQDGRAAAVTFDGDVWMISGLAGELNEVRWKRFASGLNEPLSLCIRNGELFVFDRNGIWRLRDTDGNGEADRHELFCNDFSQTAETREYAGGIRLAPDGSFIIAKGGQQGATLGKHNGMVMRVSADGKTATPIGWGLREPFIGVNPKTGLVTASDQQGNYIPATPLHIIRDNRYYGFLTAFQPKEKYPAPIADPLTWIPHSINASAAAQIWLSNAKMGALNDALIHIGYFRPELFLVRLNERSARPQAAVMSLTRNLEFAPLNGSVNPIDGQLYAVGFQIWGTTAKQVSGLGRLRYTGIPSTLPREIVPMDKGILLRFDVAMDAQKATNLTGFSVERWNYKRTAQYGSPHYKLDGSAGQERMMPSSIYLSKNGKSIFVGIPDMKPVMQMRLGWALTAADGVNFEQNAYFTPYELTEFKPVSEGFAPLTVDLTPHAVQSIAATPITAEEGRKVSELMGCVACHSADGTTTGKIGPSWKGLFGNERVFSDGKKALADEAYLRESIHDPVAKVVRGFEPGMPSYDGVLSESQVEAVILYIKTLK